MEHCCFDFDCKFRLYSENKSPTVGKKSLISRKSAFCSLKTRKKVSLTETIRLTFLDEMGDFGSLTPAPSIPSETRPP